MFSRTRKMCSAAHLNRWFLLVNVILLGITMWARSTECDCSYLQYQNEPDADDRNPNLIYEAVKGQGQVQVAAQGPQQSGFGTMLAAAQGKQVRGYKVGVGHGDATLPPFQPLYWTPFHEYVALHQSNCRGCPRLDKWEQYFPAYHMHFERFRGKPVTLVEVGVQSGGSPLMWRWYFGDKLKYIGIDINPSAKQFQSDWAEIHIGDQSDPAFWEDFRRKVSGIDIFLDDGGHSMKQQTVTFKEMFTEVNEQGVYVTEDLATSYANIPGWEWGGVAYEEGQHPDTFLEYSKTWVDWLNSYFMDGKMDQEKPSRKLSGIALDFATSASSIHFYSQVVVVEKGKQGAPTSVKMGDRIVPYELSEYNGEKFELSLEKLKNGYQ